MSDEPPRTPPPEEEPSTIEPVPETPGHRFLAIGVTVILLVVGAMALALHRGAEPPPPFDTSACLAPWVIAPDLIATQLDKDAVLEAQAVIGADEAPLVAAMIDYNREEFGLGLSASSPPSLALIEEDMTAYASAFGLQRFQSLGLSFRGKVLTALDQVLANAAEAKQALSPYIATHPDDPAVDTLVDYGGAFVHYAIKSGLVVNAASFDETRRFLAGVAFKHRWLVWTRKLQPPELVLTIFEQYAMGRWKIESSAHLDLSRRTAIAVDLAALMPTYPAFLKVACRAMDQGAFSQAKALLAEELAARPGSPDAEAAMTYVDYVLAGSSP